ncbi:glycosyltransferase family 9 protein [Candidatus Pacearchaeota archaeon]|nr:glycosyltransferase family 9 protein [Candidatus Pacearchaeota archaeon]
MLKQKEYRIRSKFGTKFPYIFDLVTTKIFLSRKNRIKNPKKILIIRNDHIGDMALATPVWAELKRSFPKSKITVLADPINQVLIEKDPNVDEIIDIGLIWRKREIKSLIKYLKTLKKIRKENFDVGIDLRRSWLNILLFLFFGNVKSRVSYYNINGGKAFLTHPIFYSKKINVIEENLELLEKSAHIKIKERMPRIYVDKNDELEVEKFLKENKLRNYIIISPGATISSKQWPERNFAGVIKWFLKKYPKNKIVLTGGPDEKELIERLFRIDEKKCFKLIAFNLRKFSIICRQSKLFIGNDGGADAIAWIAGARNILLNGPVDMNIHLPLERTITIHHIMPCYPCDWSGPCPLKEKTGAGCIDQITEEEVKFAIEKIMCNEKKVFNEYWKIN